MRFATFGPFIVRADVEHKSDDLAQKFNGAQERLNDASGVYIFASKNNGVLIPIYVGKAKKQSFATRLSQHLNSSKFNDFLEDRTRDLNIFLIARVNAEDEFLFAKHDSDEEFNVIDQLEYSLIGACAAINPNLLNLHGLKDPSEAHVPGYLGPIPTDSEVAAYELAKMLGRKV